MKKQMFLSILIVISVGALHAERSDVVEFDIRKAEALSTPQVIVPFHNYEAISDCSIIVAERPIASECELDFTFPEVKQVSAWSVSPVAHAPPRRQY